VASCIRFACGPLRNGFVTRLLSMNSYRLRPQIRRSGCVRFMERSRRIF
jgi:hypothetical protein